MKILLIFKCGSCGSKYEKLVDNKTKVIDCLCGKKAFKQLSTPKFANNTTGKNASWK